MCLGLVVGAGVAAGHDIPNARIDRSIQVVVEPGRLRIEYEVSLGELTLFQDLRALLGERPSGERAALLDRYGRVTGPLDAKGVLTRVDDRELELACAGFDLDVEEHPRFTFHLTAALPGDGPHRLSIRDTNYGSSDGVSRLAIRAASGVVMTGDDQPSQVSEIEPRPDWQLDDAELRRSRGVEVTYRSSIGDAAAGSSTNADAKSGDVVAERERASNENPLARLLDRAGRTSMLWLVALAVLLGAGHSLQPGHGKTLAAASVVAERGRGAQAGTLALVTTVTHMGSVALIALGLSWSGASGFGSIHRAIVGAAGFAIAAVGFWRLGRLVGGFGEHDEVDATEPATTASPPKTTNLRGLFALGIAGGALPCWDAIGLVVWADAAGRLALGLTLLAGFSLGMAVVLVAVGLAAAHGRRMLSRLDAVRARRFERVPATAAAIVLCVIGISLLMT